jgi:hypothetical protein
VKLRMLAVADYEYQVGLVYQTPENNFHNSDLVCDVLCKGAVSRAICLQDSDLNNHGSSFRLDSIASISTGHARFRFLGSGMLIERLST